MQGDRECPRAAARLEVAGTWGIATYAVNANNHAAPQRGEASKYHDADLALLTAEHFLQRARKSGASTRHSTSVERYMRPRLAGNWRAACISTWG